MPYLPILEQVRLKENYKEACEAGELNLLITWMLIEGWKVAPTYATVHKMKKDFVLAPEKNKALILLLADLPTSVTRLELFTAASMAYDEFARRVLQIYETIKIIENGDVYSEIAKPLVDQLDLLMKQRKQPLPIIIPGR